VRLNEHEYALLQAQAVARDVSVTMLAREMLTAAEREPPAPAPHPPSVPPVRKEVCVRRHRHEPDVRCPLCGEVGAPPTPPASVGAPVVGALEAATDERGADVVGLPVAGEDVLRQAP